jgi:hypothetical protein
MLDSLTTKIIQSHKNNRATIDNASPLKMTFISLLATMFSFTLFASTVVIKNPQVKKFCSNFAMLPILYIGYAINAPHDECEKKNR